MLLTRAERCQVRSVVRDAKPRASQLKVEVAGRGCEPTRKRCADRGEHRSRCWGQGLTQGEQRWQLGDSSRKLSQLRQAESPSQGTVLSKEVPLLQAHPAGASGSLNWLPNKIQPQF